MASATTALPFFSSLVLVLLLSGFSVQAADLNFTWNVSYTTISPFGVAKKVISINDQFPGPLLNVTTNDVARINVFNHIDEPLLFTWNGVQQRLNSWQDGVQGTNCPIEPGKNWTYYIHFKDQIGSFFYFPSLMFQKAAGGYGPIRIYNRDIISIPYKFPDGDFDILIADWFDMSHKDMKSRIDGGNPLSGPNGILINGKPSNGSSFDVQPGLTYRVRISNVGIKTSLNFAIQGHRMQLVETEGTHTVQTYYDSLDVHVGQSFLVLVTADQPPTASYSIVVKSRFVKPDLLALASFKYNGSVGAPTVPLPSGPDTFDYNFSIMQARSIRMNLTAGAARPNPQGSYHYGQINITRTIVLQTEEPMSIQNRTRYTVNNISFEYPDTPLKLADYFKVPNVFKLGLVPDAPNGTAPAIGTPVIDALYKKFIEIIFQNKASTIDSWHIDGYNFFAVGMEEGLWNSSLRSKYNMVDAVSRSTVQVYPGHWSAVLLSLDNMGMWNIRSQDWEKNHLGEEVYIRVRGEDPSVIPDPRDERPIPQNALRCGRAPAASF